MSRSFPAVVVRGLSVLVALSVSLASPGVAGVQDGADQDRPNIVLIFPDNLGVGEVSSYGGARGVGTSAVSTGSGGVSRRTRDSTNGGEFLRPVKLHVHERISLDRVVDARA